MPRKEASEHALRARIALERLRNGEADRPLVNLVSQDIIIAGFITRAGYGKLDVEDIDRVERGLADVLVEADRTGVWHVSGQLIDALAVVVSEYDRQLSVSRMEIVVRESDYLEKLVDLAARNTPTTGSHSRVTQ
ncbi:hypothetical protein [Paraburkholderia fungorum]|jgi:hypothetical protein|uniref:hypothetical protein n=1 Tax=Paraburkholderia fungorum TaxID=134537 RepID=UPI000401753F|nr:hypothetical protein [Paraburkholderia fungorum]PZR48600.1 MAG: hypothetical protein DI523_10555 [Paraburkholderia fungorum]